MKRRASSAPWALIRRSPKATAGAGIVTLFVALALFAPLLAPGDPSALVGPPHQPPSREHLFGTTGQGQDVLLQTVRGSRTTLAVGFAAGLAVLVLAALVGMTAGYFGGFVDEALSLVSNIFLVIPGLPLAVVLAAYLPPGPLAMTAALTVTCWAWPARVFRAQALSLRQKDFVAAAVVSGEGSFRIIFREILPNMTPVLAAGFISATIYAIGAQVGLEFLGLGNLSLVTWGTNLYWASNSAALLTGAWWTIVPTGLCVALVGAGLALVNFGLDEVGNPLLRAEREMAAQLRQRALHGTTRPRVPDAA
jgi:peptide/nickel transport system permease protein